MPSVAQECLFGPDLSDRSQAQPPADQLSPVADLVVRSLQRSLRTASETNLLIGSYAAFYSLTEVLADACGASAKATTDFGDGTTIILPCAKKPSLSGDESSSDSTSRDILLCCENCEKWARHDCVFPEWAPVSRYLKTFFDRM